MKFSVPVAKLLIWRKDLLLPSYIAAAPFLLFVLIGLSYCINKLAYPNVERIVSKEGFINLVNNKVSTPSLCMHMS